MDQVIEHKKLKTEFIFNASAMEAFRFPIKNSIRISFWLEGSNYSSPSEITFEKAMVNIEEKVEASILIVNVFDEIRIGNTFLVGVFPKIIGEGIIKKIENE